MRRKTIAVICTVLVAAMIFAACGAQQKKESKKSTDDKREQTLSGSISMAGSTSMEKLANALSEGFMNDNPDVTVTAEFIGSSAGIESVSNGSVDIGNASRELKDSELSQGLEANVVAIDGIAVIVNKSCNMDSISKDDLYKVYTGEIKNWNALGGSDDPIVVIGREAGSGTRDAFEELLELADKCRYAGELDSTGAVLTKVASTPGAIGYISLDVLDDSVTALKLEGTEPTEENIKAGKYLLSRPFIMATKGKVSEQNEQVQAWFDYINSDEGQKIIKSVGLISAK